MPENFPSETKVLEAIKDGVFYAMPSGDDLAKAVRLGISDAMPYPSQILQVIGEAVEHAVREHLKANGMPGT